MNYKIDIFYLILIVFLFSFCLFFDYLLFYKKGPNQQELKSKWLPFPFTICFAPWFISWGFVFLFNPDSPLLTDNWEKVLPVMIVFNFICGVLLLYIPYMLIKSFKPTKKLKEIKSFLIGLFMSLIFPATFLFPGYLAFKTYRNGLLVYTGRCTLQENYSRKSPISYTIYMLDIPDKKIFTQTSVEITRKDWLWLDTLNVCSESLTPTIDSQLKVTMLSPLGGALSVEVIGE